MPIEIDSKDYPELDGLTEDEIKDWVYENAWEMKSSNEEIYSSLAEELSDQDINYDNISGETNEFVIDPS
jgi:cytochrome c553